MKKLNVFKLGVVSLMFAVSSTFAKSVNGVEICVSGGPYGLKVCWESPEICVTITIETSSINLGGRRQGIGKLELSLGNIKEIQALRKDNHGNPQLMMGKDVILPKAITGLNKDLLLPKGPHTLIGIDSFITPLIEQN